MWNPLNLFKASKENLLSASDKQLLVRAIQAAETNTSGEIRVFVENSIPKKKDALQRATDIFHSNKMNATKDRNGVLIYVAVKDKKIAIYGDQAIHEKVGIEFWNHQVQEMIAHFKQAHYIDGIENVIESVGDALKDHFPYNRVTDTNELSDEIMIGK